MKKVLLLAQEQQRENILARIQQAGVIHLQPLQEAKSADIIPYKEDVQLLNESILILSQYTAQADASPITGTWSDLARQVQQLDKQLKNWETKRIELENQLESWALWGNFSSELLLKLKSQGIQIRLWHCLAKDSDKFQAEMVVCQKQVGHEVFLATVSHHHNQVIAPDTAQEILFTSGPQELRHELTNIQKEIADCKTSLQQCTYYALKLKEYAVELQNIISLAQARGGLLQKKEFFGLQGWIPTTKIGQLQQQCRDLQIVVVLENAKEDEQPPTLIQNPRWIQSILDVVLLYATPGYQEWDPSVSIYFAFAIFFAMIVGDAGYGLTILGITLWFRRRMIQSAVGTRIYRLFVTISTACVIYGALTGTWFAIDFSKLPSQGLLSYILYLKNLQLSLFDSNNYETQQAFNTIMMLVAIYTGIIHLSVARVIQIIRLWPKTSVIAEFAWILAMWSAIGMIHLQYAYAQYGVIAGLALVFLFSSTSYNPIRRIFEGLFGLLGITQLFADILSYLRLFALGLAGAVLGSIFNKMGMEIHQAFPGIVGYILMVLVVFTGHSLNILLAVMGGFIHGLRLNFLEFYRYCFEGSGYLYQPFMLQHNVKLESKN